MLEGEERFELSISRVRAERFKPDLATPLHFGGDGWILSLDRESRPRAGCALAPTENQAA